MPENASRAEVRRAYLKKLRDGDFLPPPAVRHAFRILDGTKGAAKGDEEWLLEEEGRLRRGRIVRGGVLHSAYDGTP